MCSKNFLQHFFWWFGEWPACGLIFSPAAEFFWLNWPRSPDGIWQQWSDQVGVTRCDGAGLELRPPWFELWICRLPGKGGCSTRPLGTTSSVIIWVEVCVASVTIALFQDGSQRKREKGLYHHGPRPMSIICWSLPLRNDFLQKLLLFFSANHYFG